eukprot:TRINITY_DN756_c0_g1_i5.p1 TRINITY_DN756_c0_g1~~TRINITY_DN756_c0_g1_i5.p1  ORF type:complete len:131 (-),score=23.46 TRINITY_DN756_c0_g1_i5:981-1373(-)
MAAKDRRKATIHTGMVPKFVHIEDQLLEFIDVRRDHDLPASFNMLKALACSLDRRFRSNSKAAKHSYLQRFLKRNRISLRVVTHVGQKRFEEVRLEAEDFQKSFQRRVQAMGFSLDGHRRRKHCTSKPRD